jgi:hypothetical protein
MLSKSLFIANGGRGPTKLGLSNPSWISIPKRWPSATGLARARLMYSNTSCSAGVGSPESYSTVALTFGTRKVKGMANAVSERTMNATVAIRPRFKSIFLTQLHLGLHSKLQLHDARLYLRSPSKSSFNQAEWNDLCLADH